MEKEYWGGQEDRRNSNYYRGNSKKENNRARLLKDLYGPDMARLELEAHQRPEEHISEVLEEIMAQARMGDRIQFSDLLNKWEELVGESVSTYCKPSAIKGKTLMIEVTHASAMHVLETYKKDEILKRIRSVCKDVLSVRFIPSGSKI